MKLTLHISKPTANLISVMHVFTPVPYTLVMIVAIVLLKMTDNTFIYIEV